MPINVSDLDPAWVAAFPEALEILRDPSARHHGDLDRLAQCLERSRTLTADQSNRAQSTAAMLATRPHDAIAYRYDAWQIPNGVYVVNTAEGTSYRYNVHLVKEGDLTGQRVLKRLVNGRYKGFAFLTRNSELKLWRRFEGDANEDYVVKARWLVAKLNELGRYRILAEESFQFAYESTSVEFTARCWNCNATSYVDSFGACSNNRVCEDDHPAYSISLPPRSNWDREILMQARREEALRAQQERQERLEAARRANEEARRLEAAERLSRAREGILRSEVTPAEIR